MPSYLQGVPLSDSAKPHVNQPSGTAEDSNPLHPVAKSKVAIRNVRSDHTDISIPRSPPEEVQESPRRHPVPDFPASTAKDVGGSQPPIMLQSGKSGGSPAGLVESPRAKRQAGDKAVALIKICNVQGKKRPRELRGTSPPPAQRRKTPTRIVKDCEQTSVDDVEHPSTIHDEVISSPKSSPSHSFNDP